MEFQVKVLITFSQLLKSTAMPSFQLQSKRENGGLESS